MKYLALLILIITASFFAEEKIPNDHCLKCHSMATLGVKVNEEGTVKSYAVMPEEFYNSNHGNFLCVDCHKQGFESFPHDMKAQNTVHCYDCHTEDMKPHFVNFKEIEKDFKQSVHYQKLGGDFTCYNCHDPHSFKVNARFSQNILETVHYDNQICMDCHNNFDRINTITDKVFPGLETTHSWLPHQRLHWENVRCIDCHTKPTEGKISHLILPKDNAGKNCVECHSQDTRLTQTLYQFQVKEERNEKGFLNSIILNNSYVIGAIRNYYLNLLSFIIFGLTIIGTGIHGFAYYKAKQKKSYTGETRKEYFYPLWLRIWHWLNALFFILLIFSGINLQYASTENPVIAFATAITVHNMSGILLTVNYLMFLLLNIISGNYKQYLPVLKGIIKRLYLQAKFYLIGIFKNEPHPFETTKGNKFNPLQQITYLKIMYILLPIVIITGWALFFPDIIIENLFGDNGLFITAIIHTIIGFFLSLFMLGHIYLATTGKTVLSNTKSMFTGWHETENQKTELNK